MEMDYYDDEPKPKKTILLAMIVAIMSVFLFALIFSQEQVENPNQEAIQSEKSNKVPDKSNNNSDMLEQARKCVVFIECFRYPLKGNGSGFLISEDGYIVTNYHVIDNASSLLVTLNDGRKFNPQVVFANGEKDLAVLKIEAHSLPCLPLSKKDVKVGQEIYAIGFPFGDTVDPTQTETTVTTGIVSALREYNDVKLLQFSAAVYPGNSGGPLLDKNNGEVIGVVVAKLGEADQMCYAVDISELLNMLGR